MFWLSIFLTWPGYVPSYAGSLSEFTILLASYSSSFYEKQLGWADLRMRTIKTNVLSFSLDPVLSRHLKYLHNCDLYFILCWLISYSENILQSEKKVVYHVKYAPPDPNTSCLAFPLPLHHLTSLNRIGTWRQTSQAARLRASSFVNTTCSFSLLLRRVALTASVKWDSARSESSDRIVHARVLPRGRQAWRTYSNLYVPGVERLVGMHEAWVVQPEVKQSSVERPYVKCQARALAALTFQMCRALWWLTTERTSAGTTTSWKWKRMK